MDECLLENNHRARLVDFVKLIEYTVYYIYLTGVLSGVINYSGEINE